MNLDLMRRIDEQFLETPFYGSRQMRLHLRHQGISSCDGFDEPKQAKRPNGDLLTFLTMPAS